MAFRIQDLMADVVPGTIRWASCPGGTTCAGGGYAAASNKGDKNPQCRPVSCGTSGKPNPQPKPPGGNRPETYTDLNLLHRQLRQALDGPRA